jgi:protein-L-isoaspartate(D-aspartate) O-methyltransferase
VLPAGLPDSQQLIVVEKAMDGRISTREVLPVRFSPLENTEAAILC